jgi:lipopolysaccharide transport protein LptA
LDHLGTEQGPGRSQPHKKLVPIVFAAVVAFLLWGGPNRAVSRAQTLSQSTNQTDNHASIQGRAEGIQKSDKTALRTSGHKSSPVQPAQSAPSNSKNKDSQTPFGALTASNRGPISIQSDSLALDYKQNAVLFSGHVHAIQADGALTSNSLRVKYGKDFHEVQDMAADGNVHISQGLRWCTSSHAVMNQQQHIVILTGSPICHDDRDQIAGTRITVHLDTGKSDVEAARAVIFPQQAKTRDNETLADQAK